MGIEELDAHAKKVGASVEVLVRVGMHRVENSALAEANLEICALPNQLHAGREGLRLAHLAG